MSLLLMIFYMPAFFPFKNKRGKMKEERELFSPANDGQLKVGIKDTPNFKMSNLNTLLFLSLVLIFSQRISAQEYMFQAETDSRLKEAFNSFRALDTVEAGSPAMTDSLPPPPKAHLLPENISFGEKLFWGENGIFRSVGIAGPLSPGERKNELDVRRFMLTTHQISGFVTLALMITAAYYGQRTLDNNGSKTFGNTHIKFVDATIATYSLTALLAVLSPPPLIRRDEESTTTLHKTLAWIHAIGMIVTPILGSYVESKRHLNINDAHYHQVAGYITTGIFATSLIVITF
jgi:hypothetical protein